MEIQEKEFEELERVRESYYELIMAVEKKYPNESRHQTALRLIKEAQQPHNNSVEIDRAIPCGPDCHYKEPYGFVHEADCPNG